MKKLITLLLSTLSICSFGQNEVLKSYQIADNHMQNKNFAAAYNILKEIEPKCDTKDTLYSYIIWDYTNAATQLERSFRNNQQFDSSLHYSLAALKLIEKGKPYFDDVFASREFFMTKNVVVAYFGLGQLDNAKKYKDILYTAHKEKRLIKGIDEFFNFSFFKYDNKNIWGYEYFEELPEKRLGKSFSKVVYYVYSTNPDGTDKDQLYRLHVLMFHKLDSTVKFDYVLTKRLQTATNETSGTLYAYTYTKDIDFQKLEGDIRKVLQGVYQPDTK